ncbi:MAG: hypothetical protein ACPL7I_00510 [Myxococcota bacterium]
MRGRDTTKDGVWKNTGIPFEIKQNVYFKSNIEVEAGVVFLISPNMKITISDSGSLRLKGTTNENITIKSAKSSPSAVVIGMRLIFMVPQITIISGTL